MQVLSIYFLFTHQICSEGELSMSADQESAMGSKIRWHTADAYGVVQADLEYY